MCLLSVTGVIVPTVLGADAPGARRWAVSWMGEKSCPGGVPRICAGRGGYQATGRDPLGPVLPSALLT